MESAAELEVQGRVLDAAKAACMEMTRSLKIATSDLRKNINQRDKQRQREEESRQKKLDDEKKQQEAECYARVTFSPALTSSGCREELWEASLHCSDLVNTRASCLFL